MICQKCDHDLARCTCGDLEERFNNIIGSKFIHIGEEYQRRIREQHRRTMIWIILYFVVNMVFVLSLAAAARNNYAD